jgi:hypothetical protein
MEMQYLVEVLLLLLMIFKKDIYNMSIFEILLLTFSILSSLSVTVLIILLEFSDRQTKKQRLNIK